MTTKTLIFTDLDGTLLDHHTYLATDAFAMLNYLDKQTIPVIANTSKTREEVEKLRQQLKLESPFIVENGAAVYIPIGYFSKQPSDTATEGDYWVKSFCPTREHWLALLNEHASEYQKDYKGFSQMLVHELAKLTDLPLGCAAMAKNRQYSEPLNWLSTQERKSDFIEKMSALGANILQGGRFLHVSGFCDKGQAQQWLAAQYEEINNTAVKTISLGDSGNDSAMLESADIAVQIRSPIQAFPKLTRKSNLYQSDEYGPKGWTECLTKILNPTNISSPESTSYTEEK